MNCAKCKKDFEAEGKKRYCGMCQSVYGKRHYENNKQYYIDKASAAKIASRDMLRKLKDQPCMDCGGRFPPCSMDFDHLENKEYEIAGMVGRYGKKKILTETSKCDVVCANCHRVRTRDQAKAKQAAKRAARQLQVKEVV
jgi:L-lysine 2,3-aminomutase